MARASVIFVLIQGPGPAAVYLMPIFRCRKCRVFGET